MNLSKKYNDSEDKFLSTLRPDYNAWTGIIVMECILLIAAVYLLTAFTFFLIKRNTNRASCAGPGENNCRLIRNLLLVLLIIYTATSVFKFSLAGWIFWGPPISRTTEHCAINSKLYQTDHSIGVTSLFLFLWLRQHSLQRGIQLLSSPSPHILRLSWVVFGVIVVGGVSATIGALLANDPELFLHIKDTNACTYARILGINSIIVYVGYSLVVVVQGCILLLFIYALKRNHKWKTILQKSDIHASKSTSQLSYKLIKNCTIAAAVSTASNVTVVLIDALHRTNIAQLVNHAAWDIDNTVSLISILFCFSNWKQLLLPWLCFKSTTKYSVTPTSPLSQ